MRTYNNKNVQNTIEQMNNTMMLLYEKHLVYYYTEAKCQNNDGEYLITWNNHLSSRANCGRAFLKLDQYEHILRTGAFHCILFDGSIIRSCFKFLGPTLISHSHLWWPAPFDAILDENTPLFQYEDFLTDSVWMRKIKMRSPVRMDFDSSIEREDHPLVHMHTQNYETRMCLEVPICFNKFIKFIFQNYYPNEELDCDKWNYLTFNIHNQRKTLNYNFSKVLL